MSDDKSVLCACCGGELDGPFHEPYLRDLLRALESGHQVPFTWKQAPPTCIVPSDVWDACGLSRDEPLTAKAVRGLRDRVRQVTSLPESAVDRLIMRDAARLADRKAIEPRVALWPAWEQAQLLWACSDQKRPGVPIELLIEEFAAMRHRLEASLDASTLPAPWRTMLEWKAVEKTWRVLREAGYGRGDLLDVWHNARSGLASLAAEYGSHNDWHETLDRLRKGPPERGDVMPAPVARAAPENLDPSRCPGCKTPIPEEYKTLPRVPCLNCRLWELHTGLLVMPVAGPEGTPPKVVRHSAPFWQSTPPSQEEGREANKRSQDALTRQEGNREDLHSPSREELVRKMERSVRLAYLAFCYAESKAGKRLEDREAYNLLKEEGIPANRGGRGELEDYDLPAFDTWTRYLREARNVLGEQKYTRRAGRSRGKSIAQGDQIEYRKDDGE
jgi:hypothetical protein